MSIMSGPPRKPEPKRDRVDRNADGSLDDIVLMLEPDLMLRAEEMDDGYWWIALHGDNDRSVSFNVRKWDGHWRVFIDEDELLEKTDD